MLMIQRLVALHIIAAFLNVHQKNGESPNCAPYMIVYLQIFLELHP